MNTDSSFYNQVALITGGAGGLGHAVARYLSEKGARIALLDMKFDFQPEKDSEFRHGAYFIEADVTNGPEVKQEVSRLIDETGRLDILINCAGIAGRTNIKSHEVDLDDFDRVMEVNVKGCLTTFQAVIPHMLRRDYGRILHFASISGKEGNAGMLAYSTSKAAVIGMTKVQGKEYAETGITVNAIAPAVIYTDMVKNLPEEQVTYMTDKIPMKRCGTPEEIAALSAFIVSPEASFTTGFTFDLTGGRATY